MTHDISDMSTGKQEESSDEQSGAHKWQPEI